MNTLIAPKPRWYPAGLSARLTSPGDYLCVTLGDEPLVVLRNSDGELRALSRVCRHRGYDMLEGEGPTSSTLCGASGRVKRISCPYHAWTYDLNGKLTGAPVSDRIVGFDKGAVALPSFLIDEHEGVIFVCLDEPAPDLTEQLAEMRTSFTDMREKLKRQEQGGSELCV